MRLDSFRLKIALLSGLVTGLLLVGSGVLLWEATYRFNLDRLDREIRNVGQANLDRVVGGDHWERLQTALKFVSGKSASGVFILWVKNHGREVYRSPDWPEAIYPELFPVSDAYEEWDGGVEGRPLPLPPRRGEEISPKNPGLPLKVSQFHTCHAGGRTWRLGVMGNPYVVLIVGADIDEFNGRMIALRNRFLLGLPFVLLLAAGGAWLVARRALRPVTLLTRTAEQVTARGLNQRIPPMVQDEEFNQLVVVFNEMLDRLEKSFQQATRFSADASHELKTPLARLRLELEQALSTSPAGSPQQEVYGSLLEEVDHLNAVSQKLLLLSLADAGQLRLNLEPVDLTEMLENVIEDTQAQAPQLQFEKTLDQAVQVNADAHLLEQVLQNLSGNAIKYNQPGGCICYKLTQSSGKVIIRVANTGPGIAASDRERVFERFYRADPSRNRKVEGVGLGLSLSREILRAHGGTIHVSEGGGALTEFMVTLPVGDETAGAGPVPPGKS